MDKQYNKFVKDVLCPNQCGHLRFKIKELIDKSNLKLLEAWQVNLLDTLEIIDQERRNTNNIDEENGYSHSYAIVKTLLIEIKKQIANLK